MVDMSKMKEEALRRKREHEKKALEMQSASKPGKPASKRSGSHKGGGGRNASAQRALAGSAPQKRKKRSISRWVVDILLVLGAILIMIVMINPF